MLIRFGMSLSHTETPGLPAVRYHIRLGARPIRSVVFGPPHLHKHPHFPVRRRLGQRHAGRLLPPPPDTARTSPLTMRLRPSIEALQVRRAAAVDRRLHRPPPVRRPLAWLFRRGGWGRRQVPGCLGVAASFTQWLTVAPRLTRRAHDIRDAGATMPTRIALHNAHVSSMVRYRAAFFPTHAQIILNASWRAFPGEALLDLRRWGFRTDLVDIEVMRGRAGSPGSDMPSSARRMARLRGKSGQRRRLARRPPQRRLR